MARKEDFTEEEWQQLQRGITGTALFVSASDPGFFETLKEAGAAGRHLADARRQNPSELVRELAEAPAMGFGFGMTPQEVETATLDALRAATLTLRSKAPDDAPAYRQLVEDVARAVATAAEDVGSAETGAIAKIRSALGEA
jgi:hypothetical protein